MADRPLVSILINNHNYGRYLGEAIDSALAQTYSNTEIVVVDDGSTDSSREVIAQYGDRIRAVLKPNGGQASAFNAGFAASRGALVCLLDADDIFRPHKVMRVTQTLLDQPTLGWCFDVVRTFRAHKDHVTAPQSAHRSGRWDARRLVVTGRPPHVPSATSGLSFRSDILTRILPMPERIRITSDAYLKFLALYMSEGFVLDEELTLLRLHDSNAYTQRKSNKQRVSGQVDLLTAVSLRERWPTLEPLAVKLLAQGVAKLSRSGGMDAECDRLAGEFMRKSSPFHRLQVTTRTILWRILLRGSRAL
ncbi:MAG TPA: glycosyltransferase family A protein [Acidobacteriaceae bacterium]|jgi:glycosyltransferase involved in cell wall biosynthesis|nr:glycosyltransferase family A protein [Acidobacteriaceae bacterium]